MNDIADRNFDGLVERTQLRVLPAGEASLAEACLLFGVLMLFALILVLQTNTHTLIFALAGLGLTALYPFMKRFFSGPQLVLGLAFSWSIPMVYVANDLPVNGLSGFLFMTAALWPVIYDTMYAMVDKDDDLKIGIHSTAIWFGAYDRLIVVLMQGVFACLWVIMGLLFKLGAGFYWVLALGILCMVYQCRLLYSEVRADWFRAFRLSQWLGGVLFVALVAGSYNKIII